MYFKQKLFSGETSSGKSTLINKILGIKLFQGKVLESTSTICKIRNSNQIRVFTTDNTGHTVLKYFSNKGRLQYKEGIQELREYLKKRTSVSPDDSVDIQIVDIRLPAPFLKVNRTMHLGVCFVPSIQFSYVKQSNQNYITLYNI